MSKSPDVQCAYIHTMCGGMALKISLLIIVLVLALWQECAGENISCTANDEITVEIGDDLTLTCQVPVNILEWTLVYLNESRTLFICNVHPGRCEIRRIKLSLKKNFTVSVYNNSTLTLTITPAVRLKVQNVRCRGYQGHQYYSNSACFFSIPERQTASPAVPSPTSTAATAAAAAIPSAAAHTAPTTAPSDAATQGRLATPPKDDDDSDDDDNDADDDDDDNDDDDNDDDDNGDDDDDSSSPVQLIAVCAAAGLLLIVLIVVLIMVIKCRKGRGLKNTPSQAVESSANETVDYINDMYVSADAFNNPPVLLSSDTYTAPDSHELAASSKTPIASASASASVSAAAITIFVETKNQQACMSLTHPSPEQPENQTSSTPSSAPSEDVYAQVQKKPKKNLVLEEKAEPEAETEQVYAQVKKPKRPS